MVYIYRFNVNELVINSREANFGLNVFIFRIDIALVMPSGVSIHRAEIFNASGKVRL